MKYDLKEELLAYQPFDVDEVAYKKRMLSLYHRFANCFERSLSLGHFTASAWILNPQKNEVVLVHHKKLDKWLQPGGHADGDNNLLRVCLKEAEEETGLTALTPLQNGIFDIDIHTIPANSKDDTHFHYDVRYAFVQDGSQVIDVSDESHDVKWISLENLVEKYDCGRSIMRMVEKS